MPARVGLTSGAARLTAHTDANILNTKSPYCCADCLDFAVFVNLVSLLLVSCYSCKQWLIVADPALAVFSPTPRTPTSKL